MKKKICSSLLMILIVVGIAMSLLNFSTKAYADPGAIWGTIERGDTYLSSWWHLAGRHLGKWGGYDWYCVFDARNCVIVYAN